MDLDPKQQIGRILQAMHRISEVLANEFEDLTPPDYIFIFEYIKVMYVKEFSISIGDIAKKEE